MKTLTNSFFILNLILFPLLLNAGNSRDTLSFIHISDPHFCNLNGYHPFFIEKRQHYGEVVEPLQHFFKTIPKKYNSEFVVITGDNIDFYEAETADGDMLDTQIEQYISHISVSDVPVYLTLGNHDLASYWVNSDSTYASHQFNAGRSRAAWIRNADCFRNGTYYSRTFQVNETTYRLIFLDNGYYNPDRVPGSSPFIMDPFQLLWLDNELRQSDTDIEILFTHIPLSGGRPSGDTINANFQAELSGKVFTDLFEVLRKNSSVKLILTGHGHNDVIHYYNISDGYILPQIMTPAFGRDPENRRVVKLTEESISVSFPGESKPQYVISLR